MILFMLFLEIGWTAVSGVSSYQLYRDGALAGKTTLNFFQDDQGVKKSEAYSYEIFSVSNGSISSIGTVIVE